MLFSGTVEFIVDVDTSEFFFMEMNTRLQVRDATHTTALCSGCVSQPQNTAAIVYRWTVLFLRMLVPAASLVTGHAHDLAQQDQHLLLLPGGAPSDGGCSKHGPGGAAVEGGSWRAAAGSSGAAGVQGPCV